MQAAVQARDLVLEPADNDRLANLCGQFDEHLRQIEQRLDVQIANRGNQFRVVGSAEAALRSEAVLRSLYSDTIDAVLDRERVHMALQEAAMAEPTDSVAPAAAGSDTEVVVRTPKKLIRPRGRNQRGYVRQMQAYDLTFGIGPAGTGKTYLAVAAAIEALEADEVRRIVLVRPAVEAGERLGFLPGDMSQKVDPYLRPMYDALYEMLGYDAVARMTERNVIEIAPLAFMRGRSLNESFIILDEAQNTSRSQMKMFLTRIGFGSRAVVTGDITQVDLPSGQPSGLRQALEILADVEAIAFTQFQARDVVRHELVKRIVRAYDASGD
ncbi:MAG: PhoH family protein [Pseudomonadota bacterium]